MQQERCCSVASLQDAYLTIMIDGLLTGAKQTPHCANYKQLVMYKVFVGRKITEKFRNNLALDAEFTATEGFLLTLIF